MTTLAGPAWAADDEIEFGKTRKLAGGWSWQPYLEPGGGVQIYAADGGTHTSAVAQVDLGIKHWKKKLQGDLYGGVAYTAALGSGDTDALNGYDVHLGETVGWREKYWGVGIGARGFYNGYTDMAGNSVLDPAIGVAVPVEAKVGPSKYFAFAGIAPAWIADPDRHADGLPVMDELTWTVGAGIAFKRLEGTAAYVSTTTAAGVVSKPTLTLTWKP